MPALEIGRVMMFPIAIEPSANNGFVVRVGCGTFVAESVDSLLSQLREYFEDPEKYHKAYNGLDMSEPVAEYERARPSALRSGMRTGALTQAMEPPNRVSPYAQEESDNCQGQCEERGPVPDADSGPFGP